jgi:hypothetical protein
MDFLITQTNPSSWRSPHQHQGINTDSLADPDQMVAFLDEYRDMWGRGGSAPGDNDLAAIQSSEPHCEKSSIPRTKELRRAKSTTSSTPTGPPPDSPPMRNPTSISSRSSSIVYWLGAITAMGLASVIVEHGVERFRSL